MLRYKARSMLRKLSYLRNLTTEESLQANKCKRIRQPNQNILRGHPQNAHREWQELESQRDGCAGSRTQT
jgi:hypothetical protein